MWWTIPVAIIAFAIWVIIPVVIEILADKRDDKDDK